MAIDALEATFRKYSAEFFALGYDEQCGIAGEVPEVTVKNLPEISSADEEKLTEDYIAHLKNNVMPGVLKSVESYMVRKVKQQQLQAVNAVKDYYNSKIGITIAENVPEGEKSAYMGYKFRFAPLDDTAVVSNWTGKWGGKPVNTSATLMGFMMAGLPHTIEFFAPDADMNTAEPEFVVPFVIGMPEINIEFGGAPTLDGGIDAFMGEWRETDGKRTILSRNGDTVIQKEPDLPWYDGDVCCTEYMAEFDAASATLTLRGISTWVSPPGSDERHLELDATGSGRSYTATEVTDGKVTVMTSNGYTFTR